MYPASFYCFSAFIRFVLALDVCIGFPRPFGRVETSSGMLLAEAMDVDALANYFSDPDFII